MTLEQAVAELESHFRVHPCEPRSRAPTGEPHVAYKRGVEIVRSEPTPPGIFSALADDFLRVMLPKVILGEHLYWRMRPHFTRFKSRGSGLDVQSLYWRCCISKRAPDTARRAA